MCEQSEVQYLDGDVVWVKLGPCWWPGVVCDSSKLPPEIIQGLKKQPIAIVKFFQEETYEYVKNLNQIYKYNCRKKNEFIKKGLDMHRAKITFMDKFPADVCHAETLTGGDPDIITSDQFAPEQKPSYAAIFGTPSSKKSPKVGGGRGRPSLSTPKPSKSPATPRITHPRFVGKSDHEVRILEQTTPSPQASHYSCHICDFESTRLNVIVLHNKGHSNGTYVTPSKQKSRRSNTSPKKGKKAKSFASTRSIDEDLELIRQGLTLSADDSSDSDTEQESGKKTSGKRKIAKGGNSPNKKAKVSNICNNLLADWGDSDSNEETPIIIEKPPTVIEKLPENNATESAELAQDKTVANNNVHSELLADWEDKNSDDQSTRADSPVQKNETSSLDKDKEMEEKSSCFDFKDEDDSEVLEKSPGRKIPRVIPPKRVPLDIDINTKYESRRNVPESTYEQLMDTCDNSPDESNKNTSQEPDLEAFESVLSATAVPEVPDLPETTPETKVSADDPTKGKDKRQDVEKTNGALKNSGQSSSEVDSETTESIAPQLPKKRIVRNFEEFENLLNEQKQAEEESARSKSTLEVSKLKSQLMSKLNDPPQKQVDEEPARVESKDDSETKFEEENAQELVMQTESDDSQTELESVDDKSETICSDEITNDDVSKKSFDADVHEKIFETPDEVIPEETIAELVKKDTESSQSFESGEDDTVEISEKIENSTSFEEPAEPLTETHVEAAVAAAVDPTVDPSNGHTFEAEKASVESVIEQTNEEIIETAVGSNFEKEVPPVEEVAESKFDTHTESIESSIEPMETLADTISEVNSETVSEIPETFVNKSEIEAPTNIINETESEVAESDSQPLETNVFPNEESKENENDTTEATEDFQECHEIEENVEHTKEIFMETKEQEEVIEEKDDITESVDLAVPDVINNESNIEIEQEKKISEVIAEQPVMEEMHTTQDIVEDTRSQKMLVDISDICIDNTDNLSGLSTLAAVSELTGNLYEKPETINTELSIPETKQADFTPKPSDGFEETIPTPTTQQEESQMSEKIQMTEDIPVSETQATEDILVNSEPMESVTDKPIATLANFSMDFSDSNSESTIIKSMSAEETNTTANVEKISEQVDDAASIPNQEDKLKPGISETTNENTSIVSDVPTDFDSIESEIEKITSMETNSDKLNSFPENISHHSSDCGIVDATDIAYQDYTVPETSKVSTDTNEFTSKMEETIAVTPETSLESEIAKLTDTHPDAEDVLQEQQQNTSSSKLLEILTDSKNAPSIATPSDTVTESTPHVAKTVITSGTSQKVHMVITGDSSTISKKFDPKTSKFVIKSGLSKSQASSKSNKPIILSEKIIKPVTETENVSVKKVTSKRSYQDVEDIDTFIIQKPSKKPNTADNDQQDIILTPKSEVKHFKGGARSRGKPKIIEQTIIKAADVVPQMSMCMSAGESQPLLDDSMFDINSMPIVLSDQILTPETIENMPVVMTDLMPSSSAGAHMATTTAQTTVVDKSSSQTIAVKRGGAIQQVKLLNKTKASTSQPDSPTKLNQSVVVKNIMPRGLSKNQKVYQTSSSKLLKSNTAVITQPGKPGKFIILPSSTASTTTGSKYTVGKRLSTIKNMASPSASSATKLKAIQNVPAEPTGNKIMIVTNQQGVQSRLLLTPAQQKILGCKMPTTKIAKSTAPHQKGSVLQKSILTSKGTILSTVNSPSIMSQKSTLASQTIITSKNQLFTTSSGQALVTSEGQVLTPITQQQLKSIKPETQKLGKKMQLQQSRVLMSEKVSESHKSKLNIMSGKTKTILIKGSQGQTLKKLQSPVGDSKTMVMAQSSHKGSQLMSLSGQQIQSGLSNKQVVLPSKSSGGKSDVKSVAGKQMSEKLQKLQSPKQMLTTSSRVVQKSPGRTQMLLSPVSSSSASKQSTLTSSVAIPPLAPITAAQTKKSDQTLSQKQTEPKISTSLLDSKDKTSDAGALMPESVGHTEQKTPNQLIIQDAMGNQTTVTEGQILALPSGETVDGQPQSYVLVTVDESGNLVPISNDTLMSLDPSLGLGGDMNNIVLQIDQAAQDNQPSEAKAEPLPVDNQTFPATAQPIIDTNEQQQLLTMENQQLILADQNLLTTPTTTEQQVSVTDSQQMYVDKEQESFATSAEGSQSAATSTEPPAHLQDTQTVACSINSGESSQQLIITGDPESTQKFLASLSEGNTDLSSLLSGTDGNIIINTDGQQILLNADADNQILLSVNSDSIGLIQPSTESDTAQSSMYVTQQTMKNQDILAAALADTDVFQQEHGGDKPVAATAAPALTKVSSSAQSQLSPNSTLYPMNVSNVLETSLTLDSPIMTPLEVPSVNKKITSTDIVSALITQVPSSLELPITITDPSISQTVSQQVMLGNDMQTNLELPITISDSGIASIRSSERSSPSFVYSLPTLDEGSELGRKRVFPEITAAATAAITSDSIYNTALTGSMSMPLLTEEPEMPIVAEQTSTNHDDTAEVTSPEATISEAVVSESDQCTNYSAINTENIQTSITEKITNELQIGPIEEELVLNATDICSSLSEPPPGMFDKSSFSLDSAYLTNKEQEEPSIPLNGDNLPEAASAETTAMVEPLSNLTALSESATADEEKPVASPTIATSCASSVPEKPADECNLDLDYSVAESCDQPSITDANITQDMPHSDLSETPNSDLNSPRLDIDENSAEIPIQPTIITNLSDNFDENNISPEFSAHKESKKRANEETDEENDAKKTKISYD